jgi:nitrate/nitrite transport system substrate-binding protein
MIRCATILSITLSAAGALAAADFAPYELAAKTPNLKKAIENKLEVKRPLTFGMIKLTDCISIVAAKELGYFADEGLNVKVVVQPNWKAVQDNLVNGVIDGTHMLYGHPLGTEIGYNGPKAELVVPYNMSINGMGISVSNDVWAKMAEKDPTLAKPGYDPAVSAAPIKDVAQAYLAAGKKLTMFQTYPAGSHNMTLRYWLAAGGVNPGFYEGLNDPKGVTSAEVLLQVNPPPQMVSAMSQGNCQGFCVGEPWNMQLTLKEGVGHLAIASNHVLDGSPDKVFCMTKKFVDENPNTTKAVVRALIRAGQWLDESVENRRLAATMLAHKDYIGAKAEIIAESITGTLVYNTIGGTPDRRPESEFNIFYRRHASFPFHSHGVWALTQFRRWGMIPEDKSDSWYQETAAKVFRADIYREAFASLVKDGLVKEADLPASDDQGFPASASIDHIAFDPAKPNEYLGKFAIGKK